MTAPERLATLVVGRLQDEPVAEVLDVVRDWTTLELLAPSLWLDVDQDPSAALLSVLDQDGMRAHRAESWLALNGVTGLRIVLLQVFADSEPVPVSDAVARGLLEAIGLSGHPLVNLLVPATSGTSIPVEATLTSRPNVLLQARDGQGPGAVTRAVPRDELAQHAASGLAVVGGLWSAMDEAPFDGSASWPGRHVVVARAHARVLDSRAVLSGLSESVYRAEGTLPRPRTVSGDRLTEVPDVHALATAETAATTVVDAHAGITRFRPPTPFQSQPPRRIRLFDAVRQFLSFLWTVVRRAPISWADAVVRRTAQRLSAAATSALFGEGTSYEVVVLGLRPDGSPASHHEDDVAALIDSAQQLAGVVSPGTEFTAVDTSVFWSEMTAVGVSLADGSDVPSQVKMPMLGADRQVISRPELIVRPETTESHGLPVGVLPSTSQLTIEFDDPYLAVQAHRLLGEHLGRPAGSSDDPSRFAVIDRARHSLGGWIGRQRSYAWRVGLELAQELESARRTLAEAVRWEAADLTGAPPRSVMDAQRRTRRYVLASLAVLVALWAVAGGLVAYDVFAWELGTAVAVLLFLLWLGLSTRVFTRNQRALFQWLHSQEESLRRRQWALECSVHVAGEVHRLGVLYRQSRLWTRALGAVVHDPFGTASTAAEPDGYPTELSGCLPLATSIGVAHFDPETQGQLLHEARRAHLGIGWLGKQLHRRVEGALAARSKQYGRPEHRTVWSDTGYSAEGSLTELVDTLGTAGDQRKAAAEADDRLLSWLRSLAAEWSLAELHPQVEVTAGAVPGRLTGEAFLAPVLVPATRLDALGFSATGAAALSNQVQDTAIAAAGVPVSMEGARSLGVLPGAERTSMDRFVARLDATRQLTLEQVGHFSAEPEPATSGHGIQEPPSTGITVQL
ncbi:hypothetical protein ACI784_11100 [Geodermatophilus sp. SYSU D01186]